MMLSDFHMMLPLVTNLKEGDIFVAISTSGRTKDVLEMAQYAKRQGATVIAITKLDQSSPLYKEADIRLCMPDVEQDHRIASIASRMTQLNMIDAYMLLPLIVLVIKCWINLWKQEKKLYDYGS